jgi:hypothetical protein
LFLSDSRVLSVSIFWSSSIEVIAPLCFQGCANLSTLTFEPGCKLSTIGEYAFRRCSSLQSVCIPETRHQLTGLPMTPSGIKTVTVEGGDERLRVCGDFLVDFSENCLVRYIGDEPEVSIPTDIVAISAGCFSFCEEVLSVSIWTACTVSILEESAFHFRMSLQSICIPSSIDTISKSCF